MAKFKRRDVLMGSTTLVVAAAASSFPDLGTARASIETPFGFSYDEGQTSKSREVDIRNFMRGRITDRSRQVCHAAAEAISDRLPGDHRIRLTAFDVFTGNPSTVASDCAPACMGDWLDSACEHVRAIGPALAATSLETPEFRPVPHIAETGSGAHVVHLVQHHKGIPIFQAGLTVHFDPSGKLVDAVGTVASVETECRPEPKLSAEKAVLSAARHVGLPRFGECPAGDESGRPTSPLVVDLAGFAPKVRTVAAGAECASVLEPGPFGADITAALTWFDDGDGLVLGWRVVTSLSGFPARYLTLVDANNGAILYCSQLVQKASWSAAPAPIRDAIARMTDESPAIVPAQVNVGDRVFVGNVYRVDPSTQRQIVRFPVPLTDIANLYQLRLPLPNDSRALPAGFPDPWNFFSGSTYPTAGNSAYTTSFLTAQPYQVVVGGNYIQFSPDDALGTDQQLLNAFYGISFMHDVFYYLGFRERDGNVQAYNLGRGGVQGDRPDCIIRPYLATQTVTLPEGQISTIYLQNADRRPSGRPDALDMTIVFHEYTHIVTNRLVGGPTVPNTLNMPQSEGLGEGWSDYIPCTIFNINVVGAWAMNNPGGARAAPYDSNYPGTFGSMGIGWYVEKLFLGEVWAATLLEIARRSDRSVLLQVVVDSLKLAPPNPNFLQMRDKMFAALADMKTAGRVTDMEAAVCNGAMAYAFTRFGMGPGAFSGSNVLLGIVPDFTFGNQDLRPAPKVIGLGGVSADGATAFAHGNDGRFWRLQSGSWSEAAIPNVRHRFFRSHRVLGDGSGALVTGERFDTQQGFSWITGLISLVNGKWTWTDMPPNKDYSLIDIVGTSSDGHILWWGAKNSDQKDFILQASRGNDGKWTWTPFDLSAAPRLLVGVSADGATPVYMLASTGRLAQGTGLTDMGAPPPPTIINPNAVGLSDDVQSVMALDLNNHIWAARKKTAGTWDWTDLTARNAPANLALESVLRATNDAKSGFVVSKDRHLWRVTWDGTSAPQWTNVSTSTTNKGPQEFTRFDISGDGATAIVASKDFSLWRATGSGGSWTWTDLGVPH